MVSERASLLFHQEQKLSGTSTDKLIRWWKRTSDGCRYSSCMCLYFWHYEGKVPSSYSINKLSDYSNGFLAHYFFWYCNNATFFSIRGVHRARYVQVVLSRTLKVYYISSNNTEAWVQNSSCIANELQTMYTIYKLHLPIIMRYIFPANTEHSRNIPSEFLEGYWITFL